MEAATSVQELTARASVRAVSPKKWARFVADWQQKQDGSADSSKAVAAGLLHNIAKPRSSALLIGYLSQALALGLFTARDFALALLVHCHRADELSLPTSLQASLATVLLANPTGLEASQPFTSPVVLNDIPDVGTSASAAPEEVSALALVIPLLRQCAAGPASPQLLTLAARLTSLVPAFPAPPFDAGLEAAQLSAMLPEAVAKPLRDCLSGLMSELPMPAAQPAQGLPTFSSSAPMSFSGFGDGQPLLLSIQGQSTLPLHQMAAFLFEYIDRAEAWTTHPSYDNDSPTPAPHLINLIRLGRALTQDSQTFLSALLDAAITRVVNNSSHQPGGSVRAFVLFTEHLPVLLAWWRANADSKWPFPANLQGSLASAFLSRSQELSAWFQTVMATHTSKSTSEMIDEGGAYAQPDGWGLLSLEATAVQRYVSLGLLDEEGAAALAGISHRSSSPGESLLQRIASTSSKHFDADVYFACHAAGAGRAFGAEVVNTISNAPQIHPPEDLFVRLASSPDLLALVTAYITPPSLLELCTSNLLDREEDSSARHEDPQSCLTRFGSGVILVEALCSQFDLPLPDLLHESRLVSTLEDLGTSEQSHLNSWVKALFGSDGIDDEVILATSSQGLCRLAPTIVQQAIIAAMSGQIDLDTLHSGLSYFAQPLLSWCLGGVVGWLCTEIERQGPLSAMHLNVLQTLVLDTAFPEPLLRANARALSRLLNPLTGLEAVFQSSSFGAPAIQDKINSVGGIGAPTPPSDTASLIAVLRSELQGIRHLELAAPGWEVRLLDALTAALRSQGPFRVLDCVMTDILYPIMESDPLVQFLGFISVLDLPQQLAHTLIDGYIPTLFSLRSAYIPAPPLPTPAMMSVNIPRPHQPPPLPYSAQAIHKLLKSALLAADASEPETADLLASHLQDELSYQRTRPGQTKSAKRVKSESHLPPLSTEQRELICLLESLFEADEELRARWPSLAPLITS